MTLHPHLPTINVDDARRLTERIRLTAHTARESIEKLHQLVDEAKAGNAHVVLGYASWTAYLSDVMGEEPLRLARDQRQELVGFLAGEGMSTPAIAQITGTSTMTAWRDRESSLSDVKDEDRPATVTSLDGRERPAMKPQTVRVDTETGEVLDGKPAARMPNRRPLPDQARDAGWELAKAIERLERVAADDRFAANKDAMAPQMRGHLTNAITVCQGLLDRIDN